MKRSAQFLFVLATVMLIYWHPLGPGTTGLFRSDIIYALASLATGSWLFLTGRLPVLLAALRETLPTLYVLSVFILAGTAYSEFRYGVWLTDLNMGCREGCAQAAAPGIKVGGGILIGFLTFVASDAIIRVARPRFYRLLCYAFLVPPLVFLPALLRPTEIFTWQAAYALTLVEDPIHGRLRGIATNPQNLAFALAVSAAFLVVLTLWNWHEDHPITALLTGSLAMGCAMLLIWTGSRGMVITIALVTGAGPPLLARYMHEQRTGPKSAGLIFLLAVGTFLLIPTPIKDLLIDRFRMSGFDRVVLWRYYWPLVLRSPLGFGLNYIGNFTLTRPGRGDPIPPHSILDLAMLGGFGAVITMSLLVWVACRRLVQVLSTEREPLDAGVLIAILALWIGGAIFEGVPISHPGFWCLLGLAFGRCGAVKCQVERRHAHQRKTPNHRTEDHRAEHRSGLATRSMQVESEHLA